MDPKQQARSHEVLKMFAWCGHKLTTLCVQDFDKYAKTWQGEHCMQRHIKVLLLYIFSTYIWSMTKLKYDVTVEGSNLLPLALY